MMLVSTQLSVEKLSAEGFADLFEAHAEAIYNFVFRRTGDWSVAEDLTSVVFLQAWRRRERVDLVTLPALPWLYGVATNVLRNQRRTLRRHRAALARVPAPQPEDDESDDVAGRIDDQRRMQAVLETFERLPRADQDVLSLCVWQELSYDEAALALGVPVGTVRSRLSRARGRLEGLTGGQL